MDQRDNNFSMKLIKKDGKLTHVNSATAGLQLDFVDGLVEGQEVEVFFEANNDNGTNVQLAKIHVSLRKIAQETGSTFEEMKYEIKRRSGLVYPAHSGKTHVKSFADCSKEELGLVIEEIKAVGLLVNLDL